MANIVFLDPLGYIESDRKHRHFVRDWTGANIPGYIAFPPLDLMYAAAYLRKNGHSVGIIEANALHLAQSQVLKILKEGKPDFLVLPTTFFTLKHDKYLVSFFKNSVPDMKVIFAGPSVTNTPEMVLSDGSADFVALGELELPVLNIVEGNFSRNIAYMNNDEVFSGGRTLIDLDDLEIPARDLVNNNIYRYAIFNRKNPVTAMTISRGCPHSKCEFCHSRIYTLGQKRYRNIGSIVSEIDQIAHKYKIGEIFFRDQAFTADRELVWKICEYILAHDIKISWRVATRVDLVDRELLALMSRAGCFQISFGFETCSQEALDRSNKGFTVDQSRNAAKMAKQAGMEVVGLFVYGLLGETNDSLGEIYDFALELDVDYANFNEIFPIPGTPLHDKYTADNSILLPKKILKGYVLNANLKFNLRPRYLLKQLSKIRKFEDLSFLIKCGLNELLFNV